MKIGASLIFSHLFLFVSGCTNSTIQQTSNKTSEMKPGETIVVIYDRALNMDIQPWQVIEKEINECIDNSLTKLNTPVEIISPEIFKRVVFPNMDAAILPISSKSLPILISNTEFIARLNLLNIRYLMLVKGRETTTDWETYGGCGVYDGRAGCLVFSQGDKRTSISVSIFDSQLKKELNTIKSVARGRPWSAIIGIFPIGMPAFTESKACDELGKGIVEFINGKESKINPTNDFSNAK